MNEADLDPIEAYVRYVGDLSCAVELGRGEEAVGRALDGLQRDVNARMANVAALVAHAAGDRYTVALVVAAGVALCEPNAALLRRLAVLLAEKGLRQLAARALEMSWETRAREFRKMGVRVRPGMREQYMRILETPADHEGEGHVPP
jgi:hypothetical protein